LQVALFAEGCDFGVVRIDGVARLVDQASLNSVEPGVEVVGVVDC
jgi:hypothetical protein